LICKAPRCLHRHRRYPDDLKLDELQENMPQDCAAEHASFTETEYRRLLDIAREKYQFCGFQDSLDHPSVVWRHDVDHSVHRALAVAKLEAERNLRCVYHVLPTSRYYNVLEPEISAMLREIAAIGHEIGLHFDMDAFGEAAEASTHEIDRRVAFERDVLATVVGVELRSMSFHNYVLNQRRLHDRETICGLLNCSSTALAHTYKYVSDSNGMWRYQRLESVLSEPPCRRLHVLTHPEWWTPEPMSPILRLRRLVDGRARANFDFYVRQLRRDGRLKAIGERMGYTAAEIERELRKDQPK
jgi:hypothetical protein